MAEGSTGGYEMPFLDHLEELRWRILKALAAVFVSAIFCFFFSDYILNILLLPTNRIDPQPKIIFLRPAGMFLVRFYLAFICGAVISLPVILYQTWAFVAPGLLESERKHVPTFIGMGTVFFLLGSVFAFFMIVPLGLNFLIGMGTAEIQATWDIDHYVSFVTKLILAFGLVFQLPLLILLLARLGVVTPDFLRRNRRYAIVAIFLLAALLTPPDLISQLLMGGPLILLYELSIWVAAVAARRRRVVLGEASEEEDETLLSPAILDPGQREREGEIPGSPPPPRPSSEEAADEEAMPEATIETAKPKREEQSKPPLAALGHYEGYYDMEEYPGMLTEEEPLSETEQEQSSERPQPEAGQPKPEPGGGTDQASGRQTRVTESTPESAQSREAQQEEKQPIGETGKARPKA